MGKVRIKNVSRGVFDLSLDFVKEGRFVSLNDGATFILSEDEYDYLKEQCPGAFKSGFLKVIAMDDDVTAEKIESENVMTDEEIAKKLELAITGFRKFVKTVTSEKLLADIFKAAVAESKDQKYLDAVTKQIKDLGYEALVL